MEGRGGKWRGGGVVVRWCEGGVGSRGVGGVDGWWGVTLAAGAVNFDMPLAEFWGGIVGAFLFVLGFFGEGAGGENVGEESRGGSVAEYMRG